MSAALDAGADAVYVGLKGWSRGGAARELGIEEVAVAQREVAAAGRSLQVALNTIPKEEGRDRLFELVPALLDVGVRDVIVNDVGILAALKGRFPELRLTASVGCGARTVADVAFFRDLGAHAVVLPGTVSPREMREIRTVRGILVEVMIHMVEEFVLLGRCWMPSYGRVSRPSPSALSQARPRDASRALRQAGSVKRGGVGACFRICQEPWEIFAGETSLASRVLPSRQISRVAEVGAYVEAGVDVLKLQGRSLPPGLLSSLVRRYREAIDGRRAPAADPAPAASLAATWTVVGR